jgi:hypothetical protein
MTALSIKWQLAANTLIIEPPMHTCRVIDTNTSGHMASHISLLDTHIALIFQLATPELDRILLSGIHTHERIQLVDILTVEHKVPHTRTIQEVAGLVTKELAQSKRSRLHAEHRNLSHY